MRKLLTFGISKMDNPLVSAEVSEGASSIWFASEGKSKNGSAIEGAADHRIGLT
jgi:hypothetical protein